MSNFYDNIISHSSPFKIPLQCSDAAPVVKQNPLSCQCIFIMRDDLEGFSVIVGISGSNWRGAPADHFPQKTTVQNLDKEAEMAEIGTRLSISSCLCTILYIGPVKGTTGTWWGVEWDDPSRGKHSGAHDGHQYFSTRYPLSFPESRKNCHLSQRSSLMIEFPALDRLLDLERRRTGKRHFFTR